MTQHKVYLAGKIEKNCWRHDLVDGLREFELSITKENILPNALVGHDYMGPFFSSCDHGCSHGVSTHGLGVGCREEVYTEQNVRDICLRGIDQSDVVIAWLNREDAFGTFAEIGYAYHAKKEIYIISPNYISDLWFVYAMAKGVVISPTPSAELIRKLLS